MLLPSDDRPSRRAAWSSAASLVSGEMLTDASAGFDQTGQPVVDFRFNGQGARRFGDATSQNVGKRFAIVLDEQGDLGAR